MRSVISRLKLTVPTISPDPNRGDVLTDKIIEDPSFL